ncbi:sensor histidine kinase [Verrucomicrobiota bacterium]
MSGKKNRKCWKSAFELTVVYLVVCVLYSALFGKIAAAVARDGEHLQQIELLKGNLFVAVTALLLFGYACFMLRRDGRRKYESHRNEMALIAAERRNVSSQMAWEIGHDINHILGVISFNVEQLEEGLKRDDAAEMRVAALGNAAKRLRLLSEKLCDAGQDVAQQEMSYLLLRPVIDDAVDLAKMVRADMASTVKVDCSSELAMVGCSLVLRQALFNILLNAMDAADMAPCIIEINAKRDNGIVTIAVHDNGPGIPEELEAKIFDTFYTTKEKGSGLGLLSAQFCAQMHQGDLTICESRLGGACFCMELSANASGRELRHKYAI